MKGEHGNNAQLRKLRTFCLDMLDLDPEFLTALRDRNILVGTEADSGLCLTRCKDVISDMRIQLDGSENTLKVFEDVEMDDAKNKES